MRSDIGLLLLRVSAGGMMLMGHGWGKMMGYSKMATMFPDPFGIGPAASLAMAIFGEAICCFLIVVGFHTRWVAIPPLITMLVAGLMVHASDPWQKKELALLYAACFATLILLGSGRLALDSLIKIPFLKRG